MIYLIVGLARVNLLSITIYRDSIRANPINMKVQLSEGGLSLHFHNSSVSALKGLQLSLFAAVLILLLKLHLVVPHEFFLSVALLKIELNRNLTDLRCHDAAGNLRDILSGLFLSLRLLQF